MDELNKMREVIKELKKWNKLRNDFDAYLYELCEWGLGEVEEKPDRKTYMF